MGDIVECEIRWKVKRLGLFQSRLKKAGGELKGTYQAADFYYQPQVGDFWHPDEKWIKVREWISPEGAGTVSMSRGEVVEWKKNHYTKHIPPFRKARLYEGDLKDCKAVVDQLGFEPWLHVEIKDGRLWYFPKGKFYLAMEKIEGQGWTGRMNFVGRSPKSIDGIIRRRLKKIHVARRRVRIKQLITMVAEKEGALERPSSKAKFEAGKERVVQGFKQEIQIKKKLERFRTDLEKEWKRQEKEREKAEKQRERERKRAEREAKAAEKKKTKPQKESKKPKPKPKKPAKSKPKKKPGKKKKK